MKKILVPLSLDSVVEIECPYCGAIRLVEVDCNGIIECEECSSEFNTVSQI